LDPNSFARSSSASAATAFFSTAAAARSYLFRVAALGFFFLFFFVAAARPAPDPTPSGFGMVEPQPAHETSSACAYRVTLITCRDLDLNNPLRPERHNSSETQSWGAVHPFRVSTSRRYVTFRSLPVYKACAATVISRERTRHETPFTRENETTYLK
jgi:hypothetical protein